MINSMAIEKLYDFTDFNNLNENPFKINQNRESYDQWDIPKLGSDSKLDRKKMSFEKLHNHNQEVFLVTFQTRLPFLSLGML